MIYSYVITRDYGFAPNPFYKVCTLATCKARIRGKAQIGDWILGFGSASTKYKNKLIYAMQVQKKLNFDEYWQVQEFQCKKPIMNGSFKQVYGDNIYHHVNGEWVQSNSHHSNIDGSINYENLKTDTKYDKVLVSERYWYFGRKAVEVPNDLSKLVYQYINYKKFDDKELEFKLDMWLESLGEKGFIGNPIKFDGGFDRYGNKQVGGAV